MKELVEKLIKQLEELTPLFVNNDCVTAEILYSTAHGLHTHVVASYLVLYTYLSSTQESKGITAASRLHPWGQP